MKRNRGESHGYSITHPKLYFVWRGIRDRCYNKKHPSYHNYGGRGITVCEEWIYNSKRFCEWALSNGYQEGLQLDRIDNDLSYSESNCHFVTPYENVAVGKKRMKSNNTTGYNGVYYDSKNDRWRARITVNSKEITIGHFKDIYSAIESRIAKEIELFGEQKTNFHYDSSKKYG